MSEGLGPENQKIECHAVLLKIDGVVHKRIISKGQTDKFGVPLRIEGRGSIIYIEIEVSD